MADDPVRHDLERRVRAYADFGWEVVERHDNPARVLIRYPAKRRGRLLRELDASDRIIWVDEDGEVQVTKVEAQPEAPTAEARYGNCLCGDDREQRQFQRKEDAHGCRANPDQQQGRRAAPSRQGARSAGL